LISRKIRLTTANIGDIFITKLFFPNFSFKKKSSIIRNTKEEIKRKVPSKEIRGI